MGDDLVTAIVTRELKRGKSVRRFAVQDAVIVLVTVLALQAVMALRFSRYPRRPGSINDARSPHAFDKENWKPLSTQFEADRHDVRSGYC